MISSSVPPTNAPLQRIPCSSSSSDPPQPQQASTSSSVQLNSYDGDLLRRQGRSAPRVQLVPGALIAATSAVVKGASAILSIPSSTLDKKLSINKLRSRSLISNNIHPSSSVLQVRINNSSLASASNKKINDNQAGLILYLNLELTLRHYFLCFRPCIINK
jgi:hypothetical protein